MKTLFIALFLISSNICFAGPWVIQDLDTGKPASDQTVQYGTQSWYRLTGGLNCISGDLKSAFAELNYSSPKGTTAKKIKYDDKAISVSYTGPICTEYQPWPEGSCIKTEVKTINLNFPACDPNQKFFEAQESEVLPFQEDVFLAKDDRVANVYFKGDVQLRAFRRYAILDIRVFDYNNTGSAKSLSLKLSPNADLEEINVPLEIYHNEIFNVEDSSKEKVTCTANALGINYSLTCAGGAYYLLIPKLPVWTLGFDKVQNSIPKYSKPLTFQIFNNKMSFTEGVDYSSLKQLWWILNGSKTTACVSGNSNDAAQYLSRYTGNLSTGSAIESLDTYEILDNKDIRFTTSIQTCTEFGPTERDSGCHKWETTSHSSFVLPVCK